MAERKLMSEKDFVYLREAEEALLSACILDDEAFGLMRGRIGYGDFFVGQHQIIWKAFEQIHEQGRPIDLLTLADQLMNTGAIDHVGGFTGVSALAGKVSTAANIDHWARIVEENKARRMILIRAKQALGEINKGVGDPQEFAFKMAEDLIRIATFYNPQKGLTMNAAIDELVGSLSDKEDQTSWELTPGLWPMRRHYDGYEPGHFVVIAGRPSQGKTAFAINEAMALSRQKGTVMFFSLESTANSITKRFITCAQTFHGNAEKWVTHNEVKKASSEMVIDWTYSGDDGERLENSIAPDLRKTRIVIDESPGIRPVDVDARITKYKAEKKRNVDVVMIDYLQLLKPDKRDKWAKTEDMIGEMIRSLKEIGKKHGACIICLAQLSRKPDDRDNPRPRISDLAQSGQIEQVANVITLIYRPGVYKGHHRIIPKPDNCRYREQGLCRFDKCDKVVTKKCPGIPLDICEVIVAKSRDGKPGSFYARFMGEHMKFDIPPKEDKNKYRTDEITISVTTEEKRKFENYVRAKETTARDLVFGILPKEK